MTDPRPIVGTVKERLKLRARELGFTDVGVVRPEPTEHRAFFEWWLGEQHHGSMQYLARDDARERRFDLAKTMETVRSVIVVTHAYAAAPNSDHDPSKGIVARYARGADYHDVVVPRLRELHAWIEAEVGRPVAARPYADTGPILERDLAQRAGLGWFGKNTMGIHPRRGSYWFIGTMLLDLDLAPDAPFDADHCGSCTACLDACPTQALKGRDDAGAPVMDARRCISYLTIEHRGPIPAELRSSIGNRVFGCDICQEVCPWNERFSGTVEVDAAYATPQLGAEWDGAALVEWAEQLLDMDDTGFRSAYRRSPLFRSHRSGLLRNVCIGLGNWGAESAEPTLIRALDDAEPLVRGHAAWALGQIGSDASRAALIARSDIEVDAWVAQELSAARL